MLAHFLSFCCFYTALPFCFTGISPSTPSRWPLPVLFDINIVLGWPDGVGFRFGTVASSAPLLPGYKQVSCGPWWPITVAHMLIEKIRQPWFPLCPPALRCTVLLSLCEKWAVKTLTSPLSWNSKHAVVSGMAPAIVNTLFSFSELTDGVLFSGTFFTGSLHHILWHCRNVLLG